MGRVKSLLGIGLCVFLLLGCGGGGGGNKNSDDNSWLSISPNSVGVTTVVGVSTPFTITATSSKTISQTLYPVFIDNAGVLNPYATVITPLSQLQYKGEFATSSTLAQGSYQGNFSLWLYTDSNHTNAYPGSPWTIPYQITVGPVRVTHKLLPDSVGVAFSSTPAGDRLTKSILVADNLGKTTPWQATSDKSWLTVTAAGTTGTPGTTLTLTADPTNLPLDVISYVTVTLTSSDTSVQPIEKIQVGLWKGSANVQRTDVATGFPSADINLVNGLSPNICVDPVRPYVYLTYSSNVVDCYNIYTATKVASIKLDNNAPVLPPSFQGPAAGSMAITSDGSKLYVGNDLGFSAQIFSLPEMAPIGVIPYFNSTLSYARPNGVGVILSSNGDAVLASTSTRLPYQGPRGMVATTDSGAFYNPVDDAGQSFIGRYSMDFSEFKGGTLITKLENHASDTNGPYSRFVLSPDGARLYEAALSSKLLRLDPVTLAVLGTFQCDSSAWFGQVRVGNDGRVYYATQSSNDLFSIGILGADDRLISTQVANPQTLPAGIGTYNGFKGGFVVSADCMVLVVNSNTVVQFLPVLP
ncbi:MAG: hypothetical protein HXX12_07010 [Geothrix sp.]|uniref:BACON domain-containing protein n=1 Tax=Geothrix sp. TaxID=1962974 RepID=UPI0017F7B5E3|nr:hypothetical protein [Geothrix sp.]NWJ40704.1 hypothetical protein [Geothrix sp.]WIL21289.1 MAG: hypothetical protein QOZ81_000543 [Geothrix sp.]